MFGTNTDRVIMLANSSKNISTCLSFMAGHAGAIAQAVFKVTCRAHVVHFHLGIVEEKQQQRTLFMKLVHFFYVKIICTNQVNRQR